MERDELKSIIENVLLAADQPVHIGEVQKLFLMYNNVFMLPTLTLVSH